MVSSTSPYKPLLQRGLCAIRRWDPPDTALGSSECRCRAVVGGHPYAQLGLV
jgi:hypothetical protein